MSSPLSPQQRNTRKLQGQQPSSPGSMHSHPARESSPSPFRDRPRTIKASSMPLVPSVSQVLASQQTSQGSASQVQRLLPTPPHPGPPNGIEHSSERRMSPPPTQHPLNISTHYPRPITRIPPPHFLIEEPWQMTEELLADIERADKQQSQGQAAPSGPHSFVNNHNGKPDSPASVKENAVDRVRTMDRSSPKTNDNGQLGRRHSLREQSLRESPKARERPTASPKRTSFSPVQVHTPERQVSPSFTNGGLPSPPGEPNHRHDSPPVLRRVNVLANDGRSNLSLATQAPPLQVINTRTQDKSLPLQEAEDEVHEASKTSNDARHDDSYMHQDRSRDILESPLPSSDDPDPERYDVSRGHSGGRNSRAGHRSDDHDSYADTGKGSTDEGGFTPRSNSVALPEDHVDNRPSTNTNNANSGNNAANAATIRATHRTNRHGSSDQPLLANLDTAFLQEGDKQRPEPHSQATDHRVDPRVTLQRVEAAQRAEAFAAQFYAQQFHPDDFNFMEHPTSSYIQAYLRSPRPDAPIPPTPHSQTSPPSPSPLFSAAYNHHNAVPRDFLPSFTPVPPAGSPYPYPFSHVMRTRVQQQPTQPSSNALNLDLNNPATIQEQFVKQWQIYAQNHRGDVSDSTLSPASTPFPTATFNEWAHLHTQRLLGLRPGFADNVTQMSSPTLTENVELPPVPKFGMKKNPLLSLNAARRSGHTLRAPPRVESTQPRETSPEPSTSGEETAGEERYAVPEEGSWVTPTQSRTLSGGSTTMSNTNIVTETETETEDEGEWVEEEWDDGEDDLLDIEYHPSYVNNVEKRRRRFETKWDALMHAFQALDQQTDATMVLLAAPSHSSRFHMATSRSIRRTNNLSRSPALNKMRAEFKHLATERRKVRTRSKTSLVDRFNLMSSGGSGDLSDSSEEELKRALDAALGSLGVLGNMYEQREARWMEEMHRMKEDRERVEMLLKQVLGARS